MHNNFAQGGSRFFDPHVLGSLFHAQSPQRIPNSPWLQMSDLGQLVDVFVELFFDGFAHVLHLRAEGLAFLFFGFFT